MTKKICKINWNKMRGLVPAVIQSYKNGEVLMLAYMNKESIKKTRETGNVWFFSRSKNRLWMKGETSGNVLKFLDMKIDCDGDALLVLVDQVGKTCHTGSSSCFGEIKNSRYSVPESITVSVPDPMTVSIPDPISDPIMTLFGLINDRKLKMPRGSYTVQLLKKGNDKICAKIGEESGEVIKACQKETKQRLIEESVDLLYHMLVLLVSKNVKISQFFSEIVRRMK
ncbi:MAG TPA: bifunctional phosphoribosyl-AMP cyclohydrolase/phosphoribosyl-ATP diphosphatase HisIE [Candidatus Gracilibacteria bacterium]|nr:bifunctional phosphoribosyl-AMP cyclohydrolase/phosphoribosyl-ATP diphosphatase HisIE [Candidatus Gracilibacteria bacterium]